MPVFSFKYSVYLSKNKHCKHNIYYTNTSYCDHVKSLKRHAQNALRPIY